MTAGEKAAFKASAWLLAGCGWLHWFLVWDAVPLRLFAGGSALASAWIASNRWKSA